MKVTDALRQAAAIGASMSGHGLQAQVPDLSDVDPSSFGLAWTPTEGTPAGVGDYRVSFSAQSITKLFALSLVLARDGEAFWDRVGYEPSRDGFDSLATIEPETGIPCNPFVNAGALVVTDRLIELTGDAADAVLDLLRSECRSADIHIDDRVADSETATNTRNVALAYSLADLGALHFPVERVLRSYSRQCAIAASCAELARSALFLARHGIRDDGTRLLTNSQAKRVNASTLIGGMYGSMAHVAYRVGLPAKSGVGGGVVAIVPGHGTLCAWSPSLDETGNSIAAVAALEAFTTLTGLSIF